MDFSRLLNEPSLIAGAIRAVILAGTAFGLHWTADQIAATMLAVEAVLTLVTRTLVTPNHIAEARVDAGGRPSVPLAKQGIDPDAAGVYPPRSVVPSTPVERAVPAPPPPMPEPPAPRRTRPKEHIVRRDVPGVAFPSAPKDEEED